VFLFCHSCSSEVRRKRFLELNYCVVASCSRKFQDLREESSTNHKPTTTTNTISDCPLSVKMG
jgi:hypothetical protein